MKKLFNIAIALSLLAFFTNIVAVELPKVQLVPTKPAPAPKPEKKIERINKRLVPENAEIFYSISVVGMVKHAGVYQIMPSTRVSEVLELANVVIENEQVELQDSVMVKNMKVGLQSDLPNTLLRNVKIRRNKELLNVDLARFYVTGKDRFNPYLEDGDVIVVPPLKNTVFIDGAVNVVGTYELVKGDKITDILDLALGLRSSAYTKQCEIIRFIDNYEKTKTIQVNLENILKNPDIAENIELKPDDRIFVRAIPEYRKAKKIRVEIYGSLIKPGKYHVIKGYRFYDAIQIAGGLFNTVNIDRIEVARNDKKGNAHFIKINFREVMKNPASDANILLKDGDRIFVHQSYEKYHNSYVIIKGRCVYPGEYPIKEHETSLLNILEACGGPDEKANLDNAFIQRRSKEDTEDTEFERLKTMPITDMNDQEYAYFKVKSRELKGKFAVDFKKLWETKEKKYDVILKHDDYIYLPDNVAIVKVSGQVKKPGLMPFVANKKWTYYLELAGGYSWNAREGKTRIIRASTGEWLKPNRDTIVFAGDMIFVPEEQEIDWWATTQEVIKFIASVGTIIVIIQNVSK